MNSLETLVDKMRESYNKVINLIDKLEAEHWSKEKLTSDPNPKGKFIRGIGIRPTVVEKVMDRSKNRM